MKAGHQRRFRRREPKAKPVCAHTWSHHPSIGARAPLALTNVNGVLVPDLIRIKGIDTERR
jgi:hypothetical protein